MPVWVEALDRKKDGGHYYEHPGVRVEHSNDHSKHNTNVMMAFVFHCVLKQCSSVIGCKFHRVPCAGTCVCPRATSAHCSSCARSLESTWTSTPTWRTQTSTSPPCSRAHLPHWTAQSWSDLSLFHTHTHKYSGSTVLNMFADVYMCVNKTIKSTFFKDMYLSHIYATKQINNSNPLNHNNSQWQY